MAYILDGERLVKPRRTGADFIVSSQVDHVVDERSANFSKGAAHAGIAKAEHRKPQRLAAYSLVSEWFSMLDDDAFIAAHEMIRRYALECGAEDREAIDHVVAALAYTSALAKK